MSLFPDESPSKAAFRAMKVHVVSNDVEFPSATMVDLESSESQIISLHHRRYFMEAIEIWSRILMRNVPFCTLFCLFMTCYYLPAHLMNGPQFGSIDEILYVEMRAFLQHSFLFAAYCYCIVEIFGRRYSLTPIYSFLVPVFVGIELFAYLTPDNPFLGLVIMLIQLIVPYVMLSIVRMQRDSPATQEAKMYYEITKDGTPVAIMKGWVGVIVVIPIFSISADYYVQGSFALKMWLRLFIVPFCFFLVNLFQHIVLVGLSLQHMPKRLLVSISTAQFLQFLGRLMVSGISEDPSSVEFFLLNALMMVIEIISRISFFQRYLIYHRFKKWVRGLRGRVAARNTLQPTPASMFSNIRANLDQSHVEKARKDEISDYAKRMRAAQILDEIGTEVRVLVFVPLLLFLLHPIFPASEFQTLHNISDVLVQIFVQLAFECFGDIVSLYFEIKHLKVPLFAAEISPVEPALGLKFCVSSVCILYIHMFVSGYSFA